MHKFYFVFYFLVLPNSLLKSLLSSKESFSGSMSELLLESDYSSSLHFSSRSLYFMIKGCSKISIISILHSGSLHSIRSIKSMHSSDTFRRRRFNCWRYSDFIELYLSFFTILRSRGSSQIYFCNSALS